MNPGERRVLVGIETRQEQGGTARRGGFQDRVDLGGDLPAA